MPRFRGTCREEPPLHQQAALDPRLWRLRPHAGAARRHRGRRGRRFELRDARARRDLLADGAPPGVRRLRDVDGHLPDPAGPWRRALYGDSRLPFAKLSSQFDLRSQRGGVSVPSSSKAGRLRRAGVNITAAVWVRGPCTLAYRPPTCTGTCTDGIHPAVFEKASGTAYLWGLRRSIPESVRR